MINFCIFEDDHYPYLFPITEMRPIYTCLLGTTTIIDKYINVFSNGNITLHCRDYLKATLKEQYKEYNINNINAGTNCLFINGRALINKSLEKQLKKIDPQENTLITYNQNIIAAYLKGDLLSQMIQLLSTTINNYEAIKQLRPHCVAEELENCNIISTPADLLEFNQHYIIKEFNELKNASIIKGNINPFTAIYNETNVFIDKNVNIEDFVVINAQNGPVIIKESTEIYAHTRLEGPLYIGKHSKIFSGKINQSSIGNYCKIMGEVSKSIIEHYSNKAHSGFIGNSYIGKWVNLGAQTTTSNLKNNYSPINLTYNKTNLQTNSQFLGSIIGDYTKTAINTALNCGTIISTASNIFNHEFSTKFYPPFSWGPNKEKYQIENLLKTTKILKKRRHCELTQNQIDLFNFLKKQNK